MNAQDLLTVLPQDLNALGRWSFEAWYRVHDGYGSLDGEGDDIAEAIENGFEENGDSCIDEAYDADSWSIATLVFNGQDIAALARKAFAAAETALLEFDDFQHMNSCRAVIDAYRSAHAAQQRVDGLKQALLSLLVERNNRPKRSDRRLVRCLRHAGVFWSENGEDRICPECADAAAGAQD